MHNYYTSDLIKIKDEDTIIYDSFSENGKKQHQKSEL